MSVVYLVLGEDRVSSKYVSCQRRKRIEAVWQEGERKRIPGGSFLFVLLPIKVSDFASNDFKKYNFLTE